MVVVPVSAQNDDDDQTLEEARAELEAVRDAELAAIAELELLAVEDNQILEALEHINSLVEAEEARVERARQQLQAAEEALDEAEVALAWSIDDVEWLKRQALDYAIETYVGLEDTEGEAWLRANDATEAAHKLALLDILTTDTTDVLDQLRLVEQRRLELVGDAQQARSDAELYADELADALAELEDRYALQLDVKAEFDRRRADWENTQAELEAESGRIEQFIRDEEARLEAERLAALVPLPVAPPAAVSAPGVVGSNGWVWPTSGGVGSGFGARLHPVLGYYRQHDGLDIGGASGQDIWASAPGTVIFAGWRGGYGNAVIIQHDNGISTLYAHMSSIGTSVGATVGAGTRIGAVGSTGLSTGPHLHFEVRVNGTPVDPRGYLP